MSEVCAIGVKKLYYTDTTSVSADLTVALAKTLIAGATEITNVHQDTWSIEESEPSQDFYKNQLTGSNYREGTKTMGDLIINFTIGQYDFATKAALMGGTADENSWKRPRGIVNIKKCMIALTEDDVYVILPYAVISSREAYTDGAIGLATSATMLEPKTDGVMPEYWFMKAAVDSAT